MVDIKADTPQMWSKADLIDFLRSAQGRETIRSILLEELAHNEPVKEAIGEIAVRAVDAANAALSRSVDEVDRDSGSPGA